MNAVNALVALFSYVGGVLAIVLPFYLHKAEKENLSKYPNIQTVDDYNAFNNTNAETPQPDPLDNKGENT